MADLNGKRSSRDAGLLLNYCRAVLVGLFIFTMNIHYFHNKNDFSFRKEKSYSF